MVEEIATAKPTKNPRMTYNNPRYCPTGGRDDVQKVGFALVMNSWWPPLAWRVSIMVEGIATAKPTKNPGMTHNNPRKCPNRWGR